MDIQIRRGRGPLTYRIQRSMKGDMMVFALSGDLDHAPMEWLQELLDSEQHSRILLDLKIMAATVKVMARGEGAH